MPPNNSNTPFLHNVPPDKDKPPIMLLSNDAAQELARSMRYLKESSDAHVRILTEDVNERKKDKSQPSGGDSGGVPRGTVGKRSSMLWRKGQRRQWWQKLAGRGAARVRSTFGGSVGRALSKPTKAGLLSAGKSLAQGWPVGMAVRSGAAAAGGEALAGAGASIASAATAGLAALAIGAAKTTKALNEMSAAQLTYNRELSKASGLMAFVYAQRDIQEFLRNKEKGDRLSASALALTQSEQGYGEGTKEIEILWEDVKNNLAAGWNNFKTTILAPMNAIAGWLNVIAGNTEPKNDVDETMGEYVEDMRSQFNAKRQLSRPHWE